MSFVSPPIGKASTIVASREHHWDFARGALMLLGIPYHVAMCFREGAPWIVMSPRGGLFYTYLADFIHLFRMPAFFIVAGYFAAMLLARKPPGEWLRGRLTRLGIPFLTALILVVPVLNIFCELSGTPWAQAVATFRRNLETSGGYWIRHLWFLIVLAYYSALAAGAVMLWPILATVRDDREGRHPVALLLTAALAIGLWTAAAGWPFQGISSYTSRWLQEIFRLDETLLYLPSFLLGIGIQRIARLRTIFGRTNFPLVLLTLLATVAAVMLQHVPERPIVTAIVSGFAGLLIAQTLIAAARRWFDRPNRTIDRLVAASFVIYLLHLPAIAFVLWLIMPLGWPLSIEFTLTCIATLALSYAAARGIARVPVLNLLFNGVMPAR